MMSNRQERSLDVMPAVALASERFNQKTLAPFCERSVSEETRRAYHRVTKEFFRFMGGRSPTSIAPADMIRWRDHLIASKKSSSTVIFKLSIIRSMFNYLQKKGYSIDNPALTKLVRPPTASDVLRSRTLTLKEVGYLLGGPDRGRVEGARDYALMLLILRLGLHVSEACSLKLSAIRWDDGSEILKVKKRKGSERSLSLTPDVHMAIDDYVRLDRDRRLQLRCGGEDAFIFQPITNYRTLTFDKPLSTTMVWHIVKKWGEFTGVGKIRPRDLRFTAAAHALDQGSRLS
ncbi:MAG: tyrosine-type recombinase/integrase [Pyrinomonadaceae bacterium]